LCYVPVAMSLPGRLIDVDGVRVFFHRSGPAGGTPVVLVHGWMVGHWSWRLVVPLLAGAGLDVIALDLPGAGESDRPSPRRFAYDGEAFLHTLVGFLDALELERAALVGHSMGGAVSLLAAARRPERVEKLVLVDPLVYPFELPLEGRLGTTPIVGASLFRAFTNKAALRRYLRRSVYRDPTLVSDEWVDYLYERLHRPGGMDAAHAALRLVADPSPVERVVRAVRAPTLIAWGEDDRMFPSAWARRLAADIAGAEVHLIPACGHAPPEEKPEELAGALVPFLAAPGGHTWRVAG